MAERWPTALVADFQPSEKGRQFKKCGLLHMVLKPQTLLRDAPVIQVRNPEEESCFSRRVNCEEIKEEQRNLCREGHCRASLDDSDCITVCIFYWSTSNSLFKFSKFYCA